MYNINILSKVDDDAVRVAIIAAVSEAMGGESSLNVTRMKRGKLESPVWNVVARQDI